MERDQLEGLRVRYPLENVAAQYLRLRRSGRTYVGLCPFHPDRNPSFYIYPATQSFYCFGCGAYGDVFTFLQRMERTGFPQVVAQLQTGSVPIVREVLPEPDFPAAVKSLGEDHYALLDAAVDFYHEKLLQHPTMLKILAERCISPELIKRFRLGYAPANGLQTYLKRRKLSPEVAEEVGLLRERKSMLAGRIVIPEIRAGKVLYLLGRATSPRQLLRYLGLPLPKPLFGADTIRGAAKVWVTEGVFDWLTLTEWGYPAVALSGTHLKHEHIALLAEAQSIYLVLDNDAAGREATAQLQKQLGSRTHPFPLPPWAKDVNELAQQGGQDLFAWFAALKNAA
ncbi:MAG: toprim domain-containing protein [Chloroflexi bacterium]|nr:toprim domain-containing protein [Chloroflexota bacterium]